MSGEADVTVIGDPFTGDTRMCDDDGFITGPYKDVVDELRHRSGFAPLGTVYPVACTGSAHLAGEHLKCTSPAHAAVTAYRGGPPVDHDATAIVWPWDRGSVVDRVLAYTDVAAPPGGEPPEPDGRIHATATAVASTLPRDKREYVVELHVACYRESDARDVANLVHDAVRAHSSRVTAEPRYDLLHTTVTEPRAWTDGDHPSVEADPGRLATERLELLYEPWYVRLARLWLPEDRLRGDR